MQRSERGNSKPTYLWIFIGASFLLAFASYFGSITTETTATGVVVTKWGMTGQSWTVEVRPTSFGPLDRNPSNVAAGLYRIRMPYNESGWYKFDINLINPTEVANLLNNFTMCISAVPAAVSEYNLIQDHSLFVAMDRTTSITQPPCSLITLDRPHTVFTVDSLFGTVTDQYERTKHSPEFSGSAWRVFDVGIIDGDISFRSNSPESFPRLYLSVDPA